LLAHRAILRRRSATKYLTMAMAAAVAVAAMMGDKLSIMIKRLYIHARLNQCFKKIITGKLPGSGSYLI
jgi:hypothetical protein